MPENTVFAKHEFALPLNKNVTKNIIYITIQNEHK